MTNRLKFLRSTTAGNVPAAGGAADFGRIAFNLTDRKLWAYGLTGVPVLLASYVGDHNPASAYQIGDLAVAAKVLYRCTANIAPKAFTLADWETVSDFRPELIYRAPTTQAQAQITMGAGNVGLHVQAHASQSSALTEWRNAAGETGADIGTDGFPGGGFGRPVFRVDQVAHGFTAIGQAARFDGTNWVLANPTTPGGQTAAVVSEIIGPNAFVLQTAGRIDGLQGAAFETGTYVANTLYYASVATPGLLTAVIPPNAADINTVLRTLSGGAAVLALSTPLGLNISAGTDTSISATQTPNPFPAVGRVAARIGSDWGLANVTNSAAAPVGIVSATSGNTFRIAFAGLVSDIDGTSIDGAPALIPGTLYYCTTSGLLTPVAPVESVAAISPVLVAVSATSGVVLQGINSPHVATKAFLSEQLFQRENRIINGAFDIWQRGTSFTGNGYGADRWQHFMNGGTQTASQQVFATGEKLGRNNPKYFMRQAASGLTNADHHSIVRQNVEDVRSYAGETITVMGWARRSAGAGNMSVDFEQNFGTGGSPSSAVNGFSATTIGLTGEWVPFAATASVPSISGKTIGTNNNSLLIVRFWFSAGSDFNARSNSLGLQTITVDLWGIHIRRGTYPASAALEYIAPSEVDELPRCQRYCWKGLPCKALNWSSAGVVSWPIKFPKTMRRVPTMSQDFSGAALTNGHSPVGNDFANKDGVRFILTGTAAGNIIFGENDFIQADAEF